MDGLLAGRYELGEPLGTGATSRVVAALDRTLGRRVAVKLLMTGGEGSARDRFLREARAAASLHHPNVVIVYDAGEEDGRLYLVMELVEGGSLAGLLAARGPLPVTEAVRIADGVLAALEALHGSGIVHRDVKPANVLLATDGTVKLTDFGIARLDDAATLTTLGSVLGTPAYLPPEQAEGETPSAAGDMYSLGIVCFEMLTGAPPFGKGTGAAVALAHIREAVPDLAQSHPDVPAAIASVVTRALAKDPADRWPDAAAMRSALLQGSEVGPSTLELAPTEAIGSIAAGPAATAPGATEVMPSVIRPEPVPVAEGVSRRTKVVVGIAAAVVVAAVVVAAALTGGTDSPGALSPGGPGPTSASSADPTTVAPTTVALTTAAATTAAPTTPTTAPPTTVPSTTAPASLDAAIAALSVDLDGAGAKGRDLLDRLQAVEDANGRKQRDRARMALADIDRWLRDGQLTPGVAETSRQLLEPIAESADGDGESDDDD